jgi:hypothetical protein
LHRRLSGPRQVELDRRTAAELAVDLDVPAGLLDEAEHLGQPQTRSLPLAFGGEERLEGASHDVGDIPVPVSVTAIIT